MIVSVEEAMTAANVAGWSNEKLEMRLRAIEQTIRAYTNNNFQVRGCRAQADIRGGLLYPAIPIVFSVWDTVQISESTYNNGLYTVSTATSATKGEYFEVDEPVQDEHSVLVTKVVYPADVRACAINLLDWEASNREKVGIQSETISRHSVTYYNMDSGNSTMGYPSSLLGCLKPYRKARC